MRNICDRSLELKLKWGIKSILSNSVRDASEVNFTVAEILNQAKLGKAFNSGVLVKGIAYRVVIAYFRHKWTNYDEVVRENTALNCKRLANTKAKRQMQRWIRRKQPLVVKDIRGK